MTQSPSFQSHHVDFDRLMGALDVAVRTLARLPLGPSRRVLLPASDLGIVCMCVVGELSSPTTSILQGSLTAGTVIVVPPGQGLVLDVVGWRQARHVLDLSVLQAGARGMVATHGEAESSTTAEIICGYFGASFASSIDLLAGVCAPIIEHFPDPTAIEGYLDNAVGELAGQEPGMTAMANTLFKQALICVFRHRMRVPGRLMECLLLFRDPQIAKAFADMTTRPGASHTVTSLAATASLSRSAFMARFSQAVGRSPMAVLRQLRMQRAMHLLAAETPGLAQIAHTVGYGSRSGFVRAFRQAYGRSPLPEDIDASARKGRIPFDAE